MQPNPLEQNYVEFYIVGLNKLFCRNILEG